MGQLISEQVHPCQTAEELLEALSASRDHWGKNPQTWCFRGQGRDLPLSPVPSAKMRGAVRCPLWA
jgi:hypothetical protein